MSFDDPLSHEEAFHEKDKKQWRSQRRALAKRDRSKYKKTDWEKYLERRSKKREAILSKDFLRGRVLAMTQSGILVDSDGALYSCVLRGHLKKDRERAKNLIAVGDFVHFQITDKKEGVITVIEERYSILSRAENIGRRREQLIAVNIDQALITNSLFMPTLKPTLIDRYLIATLKGNMSPVVIINKIDLLQDPPEGILSEEVEKEKKLFQEVQEAYSVLEIPILAVSVKTGEGLDALRQVMEGKTSVFSGQSGTGKSSLINAVTGSELRVGEMVEGTRKGTHTTTAAHLLPLEGGGFCVDTPGIKSFGVWDLEEEEVQDYYPEIQAIATKCKYPDCTHFSEPECAVQHAVESGKISRLRFDSYCALIQSTKEKYRRR